MNVWTVFDQRSACSKEQAGLIRLFDLTWTSFGWQVRILPVSRSIVPFRSVALPRALIHDLKIKFFAPWWTLNFGLRPYRSKHFRYLAPAPFVDRIPAIPLKNFRTESEAEAALRDL